MLVVRPVFTALSLCTFSRFTQNLRCGTGGTPPPMPPMGMAALPEAMMCSACC